MEFVFRDPQPRGKPDKWVKILDALREEGSGRWAVISEDSAITVVYHLRKRPFAKDFELSYEKTDDAKQRGVIFARWKGRPGEEGDAAAKEA